MTREFCPVCAHARPHPVTESAAWALVKCRSCGFVWKVGETTVYEDLPAESYTKYNFDRTQEVRDAVTEILRYFPSVRGLNLCEIGCGMGVLLDRFRSLGLHVSGVEPSRTAADLAWSTFGLTDVVNGYFAGDLLPVQPDVYLLWDVLEHLEDPATLLAEIRRTMKKDAILVVKSGNPRSINARLYPERWWYFHIEGHVAFFTRRALAIQAEKAGLRLASFVPFRHAYGSTAMWQLSKNAVKALGFHLFPRSSPFHARHFVDLANDHFIAVLKIKAP